MNPIPISVTSLALSPVPDRVLSQCLTSLRPVVYTHPSQVTNPVLDPAADSHPGPKALA